MWFHSLLFRYQAAIFRGVFLSHPVWLILIYNRHARGQFIRSHRRIFKYQQPKQRTALISRTSNYWEELRQGRAQAKLTFEEDLHLRAQRYGNDDANAVTFVRVRTQAAIEKDNINQRSVVRSHENIPFVRHQPKAWLYMCSTWKILQTMHGLPQFPCISQNGVNWAWFCGLLAAAKSTIFQIFPYLVKPKGWIDILWNGDSSGTKKRTFEFLTSVYEWKRSSETSSKSTYRD